MRLARALEEKLLDTRLRDKLLSDGKITKEQLDSYMNGLSDDEANSTYEEEKTKEQ